MELVLIFLAVTQFSVHVSSEMKVWDPKQQDMEEWHLHSIKCPKTALKFDGDGDLEFLEGHSHERQIIFAKSGWYVFQDHSQIVIGESVLTKDSESCADAFGTEVIVHAVKSVPWASPSNWQSATNNNPAKPDIEKIPCDNDEIVFNTSVVRVDLDGLFQVQMKRISINDHWMTARDFGSFCKTVLGQKQFDNSESVDFSTPIGDPAIKSCQSNAYFYQSLVCENVKCEPAHCIDPIRPQGFCCDSCGASAQIEIHPNSNLRLNDLNNLLARKLSQLNDKLFFHSSFFNHQTKFLLQINIVEGVYEGNSVTAMEKIVADLLRKRFEKIVVLKSGMPFDPTVKSNLFALTVLPLLMVSALLIGAYKLSYDDSWQLNWGTIMHRFTGRSQFIFAQFENVLEDNEGRITISHSVVEPISVETGTECQDDSGMEMVAGGPEEKTVLPKDKLDEVVETISANESVNLISVEM